MVSLFHVSCQLALLSRQIVAIRPFVGVFHTCACSKHVLQPHIFLLNFSHNTCTYKDLRLYGLQCDRASWLGLNLFPQSEHVFGLSSEWDLFMCLLTQFPIQNGFIIRYILVDNRLGSASTFSSETLGFCASLCGPSVNNWLSVRIHI